MTRFIIDFLQFMEELQNMRFYAKRGYQRNNCVKNYLWSTLYTKQVAGSY
ncbi:hypothetical protein LV83_00768 [Algoriphagus yeomjeoni]|uniref:Uncharacterized protein n=1 Tax=Algoriphagus yeomjeoni TaxID=291403 RepID=A0A327PRT7_9BACT|nr:hypothetical protein LV83_00768 [Algoriphagus yeomjeoni]